MRRTVGAVDHFVKTRAPAAPGSIPAALDMFRAEVRFYREVAPIVGVRVPACYRAEDTPDGTRLELEDLSAWAEGADLAAYARMLAAMHRRWAGRASVQWPWLRRAWAATDLVGELFDRTWPMLAARPDMTSPVRNLGESLVGRVVEVEAAGALAGPVTLVHGDASSRNVRTSPTGELALVDWEDVSAAPGITDLAWLLICSTAPAQWAEVIVAYEDADNLAVMLPPAAVQGMLSLADTAPESANAAGWIDRLTAATLLLAE